MLCKRAQNRKLSELTQLSLLNFFDCRLFLRVYCSSINPLVRHQASEALSCVRIACREGSQHLEAFEKLVITCCEAMVSFILRIQHAPLNV